MTKKKGCITVVCLIGALFGAFLLSMTLGSTRLSPAAFFGGLFGRAGFETESAILHYVRLPRTLAAVIAGVGLSLSGVLLQSVMDNPMAGPNTIGVNAGAGLFAVLSLTVFPAVGALLPFAAFLGALISTALVLLAARWAGGGRTTVILAGIACTSLFQAGISFFSVIDTDVLAGYSAFSIGGFSGVPLAALPLPAALITAALLTAVLLSRRITLLSLGDGIATSLGVRVRLLRTVTLALAALSAAAVISFAGLLGFVGLIVPHIARRLTGHNLAALLLSAPLVGATLLLLADLGARTLLAPSDIPVGIVTSLIGAPFFFLLLLRRRPADA